MNTPGVRLARVLPGLLQTFGLRLCDCLVIAVSMFDFMTSSPALCWVRSAPVVT